MAAKVKFYSTVASKLADLPVVDGQFILVRDQRTIYVDLNGMRLGYHDIQVVSSESDRTQILAPTEGFYYVDETNVMWRYKGGWKQITPSNVTPFVYGEFDSFPKVGKEGTLYATKNETYIWDSTLSSYICIANKTEWKEG